MQNSPKTLLKAYLASQTFTGLSLIAYSFNSAAKKFHWLRNIYYCLCKWNFPWWKGENSSFDITLMREHLLVRLQLEKISSFPKTNKRFYRCRSIPLFFIYIVTAGKPTFMIILNHMMDILWQTEYHKKCMNIQVKVFWDEKYHMQWKCSVWWKLLLVLLLLSSSSIYFMLASIRIYNKNLYSYKLIQVNKTKKYTKKLKC